MKDHVEEPIAEDFNDAKDSPQLEGISFARDTVYPIVEEEFDFDPDDYFSKSLPLLKRHRRQHVNKPRKGRKSRLTERED